MIWKARTNFSASPILAQDAPLCRSWGLSTEPRHGAPLTQLRLDLGLPGTCSPLTGPPHPTQGRRQLCSQALPTSEEPPVGCVPKRRTPNPPPQLAGTHTRLRTMAPAKPTSKKKGREPRMDVMTIIPPLRRPGHVSIAEYGVTAGGRRSLPGHWTTQPPPRGGGVGGGEGVPGVAAKTLRDETRPGQCPPPPGLRWNYTRLCIPLPNFVSCVSTLTLLSLSFLMILNDKQSQVFQWRWMEYRL